jgi:hypothetical protein
MPYSLALPQRLGRAWKVKIRDRERNEPPHVTVLFRTRAWRYDLRDLRFLDREPPPDDVPREVVAAIHASLGECRRMWDLMYPENPVGDADHDDG